MNNEEYGVLVDDITGGENIYISQQSNSRQYSAPGYQPINNYEKTSYSNGTYGPIFPTINQSSDSNNIIDVINKVATGSSMITFMIIMSVVIIIISLLVIYFGYHYKTTYTIIDNALIDLTDRVFKISLNVENNLINKITIGTNIGDFVACLFNAYGTYSAILSYVEIGLEEIYECFQYWTANNDYNNVLFKSDNYNKNNYPNSTIANRSYKLHTLPCYIADIELEDNNNETWGESNTYGYIINYLYSDTGSGDAEERIYYKNDKLKIQKSSNIYTLLELDKTTFAGYKNKFFKFLYENYQVFINVINDIAEGKYNETSINLSTIYKYYRYFILAYKIQKDLFSCTSFTIDEGLSNEEILKKYANDPEKTNNLAYWLANGTDDLKKGCSFTMTYMNKNNKEKTSTFYCSYYQKTSNVVFYSNIE